MKNNVFGVVHSGWKGTGIIENALKMIARGKLTLEEIAEDSGLTLEEVKELADKRSA